MGYRTIKSAYKTLIIQNTSGTAVSLSGATIAPGKSREVAAYVFMQDKFRSAELSTLVRKRKISVSLSVGGAAGISLGASDLQGIEAPVPVPWTSVQSYATLDLPAVTEVPEGTVVYDSTLATLVYNDGAAWV